MYICIYIYVYIYIYTYAYTFLFTYIHLLSAMARGERKPEARPRKQVGLNRVKFDDRVVETDFYGEQVQGYLAHKKPPPPRALQ